LADLGRDRRKVAILGDMYELGRRTVEGHQEVGAAAAEIKVDVLITVGKLAVEIAFGATLDDEPPVEVISLSTNAEVKKYLAKIITPGDVVLVKGSRGCETRRDSGVFGQQGLNITADMRCLGGESVEGSFIQLGYCLSGVCRNWTCPNSYTI